jgi:hypothetical protein
MTRQELIERIKKHEAQCAGDPNIYFGVAKVVELADGVLAVRDTDGEHTIYFDKSKCQVREGAAFDDAGLRIRNFPSDTGFMDDVTARTWQTIARAAKMTLEASSRGKIKWHDKPASVQY